MTTAPALSDHRSIRPGSARAIWAALWRNPLAVAGMITLAAIVTLCVVYPMVSPYSFSHQTDDYQAPASPKHWLGTDDVGYDEMTRLCVGGRISLFVGVGVETIILLAGGLIGLVAGYYGRWIDTALMRLTDIMFAFPDVLLAILIMAVRGPSLANLFVALTVAGWPALARLVRGQALSLRQREFVEAARAIGVRDSAIICRHILPNLVSPMVVFCTIDIAGVIIAESTLSFLGIGVQAPMPSWGSMISTVRESDYWRSSPGLLLYPSLCLALTVLSLNFIGDALRDALDPRRQGRI
ncbi:MAG: ABC transporter permease [Capsulimonadaceae bacterium]